ncbi:ShlB/FhaC/HecB family hemolysin secretion/activation protein [Campylobacter mucosalis]|uniref:Hemolysin secretion/activation protein, ShlB/FhaC/HecB family n=1 Tax=Campylobacter mucosalis CCUG 21559 TaxID=1032067 RepID=A0A6G5QJB7_9BACT|nr:ShlB/FhaC/HecB family hemolysin secretion/activation protein [Campylobacter mucosalis]QCD45677.1 hemolysin secretion/activation protein, ShlB/FhaC/HecB family [Campylobacter mucosalis CCUG 21559]
MFKILSFLVFSFAFLYANIEQREFKNEQDRLNKSQSNIPSSNINLQSSNQDSDISLVLNENPCFEIDEIILNSKVKINLDKVLKKLKFQSGICLGEQSINAIIKAVNNEIIGAGYITSSVIPQNLNLKSRKIVLDLNLGKIDKITINNEDTKRNRASLFSAFGEIDHQKALNIRDVETALENIQNATFGNTQISLSPSAKSNSSDILITRRQRKVPITAYFGLDNFGSKPTGKYQGSFGLSALNLLGFNEIYTLNYGGAVFKKEKTKLNDESKNGGSNNFYVNFKVPFGALAIDYTHSHYSYHQVVAGAYNLYKYSGTSDSDRLNFSYLIYRDDKTKLTPFFAFFHRKSKNYIEDFELTNQRRKTSSYEVGTKLERYFLNSSLNAKLTYKRGTGMLDAIPAPEQNLGEGTSRMKIWLVDVNFKTNYENFSYDMNFYAQYNKTPLTLQDRISIGGIYSVRGFDGQMSLSGQKGFYLRNTLAYRYYGLNEIYTALDLGAVYSVASEFKSDNKLIGTGVGIRGKVGSFSYDLLAFKPLKKPEFFTTKSKAINFTLSYQI